MGAYSAERVRASVTTSIYNRDSDPYVSSRLSGHEPLTTRMC
jgi:hypothetical protein